MYITFLGGKDLSAREDLESVQHNDGIPCSLESAFATQLAHLFFGGAEVVLLGVCVYVCVSEWVC
jgi:hypothetical protein